MFNNIFSKGFGAAALVIGLSFIAPATANAGGKSLSLYLEGGNGSVYIGKRDRDRRHNYKPDRRHFPKKYRHYSRNKCEPREAVHKARSIGVRHAHIDRVGRRLITVEGRKRGRHVTIGFIRHSRHCEIAFFDRSRGWR